MSQTRDERFQELALKLVSFECPPEEKAELRRLLEENPARREQLQQLCLSVGIAREVLPLADALEATEGRLSVGELASFKGALARRREEQRRQAGGNHRDPAVIDAEVVPEKRFNGYKLGFYALLLLLLIVGCVLLLKSCVPNRQGAVGAVSPPPAVEDTPDPSPAANVNPTPSPSAQTAAVRPAPATRPPKSRPAIGSKTRDYTGSQWVKVADGHAKPGSFMFFRSLIGPNRQQPLIEGAIGPNGSVPKSFLLFSRQGNSWDARSFPDVDSNSQRVIALDASRILVTSYAMNRTVALIEKGQSRDIVLPGPINCLAAHADAAGRIFLHDHHGNVLVVSGSKITQLATTDPAAYVQADGNPTGKRRGFVRTIAQADSGDTMGIYFAEPAALGPAALVRFNGNAWELVCSLGEKYPRQAIHFLDRDTMVAALSREILVVEDGAPRSLGLPAEFEADRSAEWLAVRAASADDFVAVGNYGAVYRCYQGQFELAVEPLPTLQAVGNSGFRSVMIAPDGVIYAVHAVNLYSLSTLYQLRPK